MRPSPLRLACVAAGLAAAAPRAARAQAHERPRVVLLDVEGAPDDEIRNQMAGALVETNDVLGLPEWARMAERLGTPPAFTKRTVADVAPELRARAVVQASLKKRNTRWQLAVTIRNGKTGDQLDAYRATLAAPRLSPQEARGLGRFLARTVARGQAGTPTLPPEPEPAPAPEPEADATAVEPAGEAGGAPAGATGLALTAGLTYLRRSFEFADVEGDEAAASYAAPSGALRVAAELWGAAFSAGALADVGLAASFEQALGLKSRLEAGEEQYPTTLRTLEVGARYRHRLSAGAGPELRGLLGLRRITFAIDADPASSGIELPDLAHQLVRLGAGAGFAASPALTLSGALSYLVLLGDSGDLGAGGGGGLDVELGADYRVAERFALGARLGWTRVSAKDVAPAIGPEAAGGAIDQYLGAGLAVTYLR